LEQANGTAVAVLHPFPESEDQVENWAKGGLYPLVPYWGRIANATLRYRRRTHALQPFPEGTAHTLHGIAQRRPWQIDAHTEDAATLSYAHHPDRHWPWPFLARMQIELSANQLRVAISVCNTGVQSMPAGIGLHPYLPSHASQRLLLKAERCWEATDDCLAIQPIQVPVEHDFCQPKRLGPAELTVLYQGWQLPLTLTHASGPSLVLGGSDALDHLVLHQPEGAPYVCVEPVSHTADAFNLHARGVFGTGHRSLAPGEVLAGSMSLAWASD
jgi:aldose 1-epimerase